MKRLQGDNAESIPDPGHLFPKPAYLDLGHTAAFDCGNQLLLRKLQQPAPIAVDKSGEDFIAMLVRILPGAYRQLDEDKFVEGVRLVPERPRAVCSTQAAVDLEQLVSSRAVQCRILR